MYILKSGCIGTWKYASSRYIDANQLPFHTIWRMDWGVCILKICVWMNLFKCLRFNNGLISPSLLATRKNVALNPGDTCATFSIASLSNISSPLRVRSWSIFCVTLMYVDSGGFPPIHWTFVTYCYYTLTETVSDVEKPNCWKCLIGSPTGM